MLEDEIKKYFTHISNFNVFYHNIVAVNSYKHNTLSCRGTQLAAGEGRHAGELYGLKVKGHRDRSLDSPEVSQEWTANFQLQGSCQTSLVFQVFMILVFSSLVSSIN